MTSQIEIDRFVQLFTREIEENNAAVFMGAGMSAGAGYVDWKGLLQPLAEDIGLDIERESDLVSIAQYYVNHSGGNRSRINQLLIDEFSSDAKITKNHRILARLPISVYWTTNYDKLIERALGEEGKVADVKYSVKQLQITKRGRSAVVYKMHGDVDHPTEAVLIKDDYERYHHERQPFLTALSGDLVSMTFLFLGLSFSDPNLDYILSRIRIWLDKDARQHFAILRRPHRSHYKTTDEFEYAEKRQPLFINDLKRFGINVLVVDEYTEITNILERVFNSHRSKSVFVSGSADDFNPWSDEKAYDLVRSIGKELIRRRYRIVSGFGISVGSHLITGALEEIYTEMNDSVGNKMILKPFPQNFNNPTEKENLYKKYREDIVSLAGVGIFLFGNKLDGGSLIDAPGVLKEFEIANESNLIVIPIGATGSAAKKIWNKVRNDPDSYYKNAKHIVPYLDRIGSNEASNEEIIDSIFKIIEHESKS